MLVHQFNKLRDAYKEIYMYLKQKCKDELPRIPKVLRSKKYLRDGLFED
jgi:hypothetical protein